MSNSYFQFKQFRIEQDRCAMKVGTDGVILGAWADVKDAKRILDVGTGTGLIAIMLAQRSPAIIDAIEIDKEACQQASENGRSTPWSNRLNFLHTSFEDFIKKPANKFDLIISNPPYHKETIKSPDTGRRLARQSFNLHYSSLIKYALELLNNKGRLSMILPSSEQINVQKVATEHSLYCIRLLHIIPSPGKEVARILIELSREYQLLTEDAIIIEERGRHNYSSDYIRLTKDFYLKF